MRLPKYSDVVSVHWGNTLFGFAGVVHPQRPLVDGTFVFHSDYAMQTAAPNFSASVLELRKALVQSEFLGAPFEWAILNWVGDINDPYQRLWESFTYNQTPVTQEQAVAGYRTVREIWLRRGRFLTCKPSRGALEKPKSKLVLPGGVDWQKAAEIQKEKRLHDARLKVLGESWPITYAAIKGNGDKVRAFEYEIDLERPDGDAVNTALAAHWPELQHATAKEVAAKIKSLTNIDMKPRTLEKRWQALGLETARSTGPKERV